MPQFDHPVAVMDADCALCSWGARMIHRLDRTGDVRIAPIQSATGAALMRANGLDPIDPDSWLFIVDGTVWRDFDAVIRLGERAGGWGRVCSLLRLVPRPLRDWLYARVARNRYAVFGRGDMCALPDPAFQARLMT
ncbi:thiol-disulfide oxidoreductase DCC family protein [Cognatiyoonia sp. IB215182]|uniref:thiol-disulfide oxidoreductase DCC family protein n=1 Tax=Cognatiyoonia sp. IB215182 TaxID=3097353 RepID=UPI002A15891A|nr:DCC1-like thiol-disulfide oxidoreductase family protein [Cognatiyoonia sp. IB215182]MDX8353691.1 DCC1-like thiol-disulfide oxidoreductase family protein [Cognatiyoonia sp. IB215182]